MRCILFFSMLTLWGMACKPVSSNADAPERITLWSKALQPLTDSIQQKTENSPEGYVLMSQITEPAMIHFSPAKDKANGKAALIVPGGGYWVVAAKHEGEDVARWLTEQGFHAFVLHYRLPDPKLWPDPTRVPLTDAKQAMQLIRKNSRNWGVQADQIGVVGFSAGGHLAGMLCTPDSDEAALLATPNWAILVYPFITLYADRHRNSAERLLLDKANDSLTIARFSVEQRVNVHTPPALLVHAYDDTGVSVLHSRQYFRALAERGIACDTFFTQHGGHGKGLGDGTDLDFNQWPNVAKQWLARR
jgi:acetyl esterase/lipase